MKTPMNAGSLQSKKATVSKKRPEIRDDMDSRENEEQSFKGSDTTHNKKEVHSKGKKATGK